MEVESMPVTIRISTMPFRDTKLRLLLMAALLPLPLAVAAAACGGSPAADDSPAATTEASAPDPAGAEGVSVAAPTGSEGDADLTALSRTAAGGEFADLDLLRVPWFPDLDEMVEVGVIRALVPMSKTLYFLDGADQRGIAYEAGKLLEETINEGLDRGHRRVHVVMVPVARDNLLEGLLQGYGDIAIGNLTMTEERQQQVDFTDPVADGVSELVITGPGSPQLSSLDDLSGQEVYVRHSSSYYESLSRLNERFRGEGRAEMMLTAAPEILEDEDLLEMVNAGLVAVVVVDSHKARLWAQIFTDLVVHEDLALATDQHIGWAFRKESPQLAAALNAFVAENRQGTLMGNILINRYLRDTKWAKRALDGDGRARLSDLAAIFRRYGEQYDMPWLLLAAQGYQESGLDQSVVSPAGAIGVMQLLPSTAADPNIGIPDIREVDNNVHAGAKYVRFIYDRYFAETSDMSDLDRALFSFASYNAGPARVAQLRGIAADKGLDPDVWFRNVELIAAQEIGRETVQYVSNIYKYFLAYERIMRLDDARREARQSTDSEAS
jgi:membrane-bound lytic murein transglycosylase MltF